MRIIIAVTAALAAFSAVMYMTHNVSQNSIPDEVSHSWTVWKQTHGRAYGTSAEEKYRKQIFHANYNFITQFTSNDMQVAFNKFGDMTNEEFTKQFLGFKQSQLKSQDNVKILSTMGVPDAVDWRSSKSVTDVKNQGSCGSCWAFSTTGSMESRYMIKNKSLPVLSEQQLVDCSTAQGNQGCNGGLMDQAFTYAKTTGLNTEDEYPYKGRDGTCAVKSSKGVKVTSFADVKKNSPSQLKAAVAEGPVSIALDGAGLPFQFYFGGIVRGLCGTSLDHGVLIVGYGSSTGILGKTDYWIVKNSWGGSWGEKGYIRIENNNKEGDAGICGLNQSASYPIF